MQAATKPVRHDVLLQMHTSQHAGLRISPPNVCAPGARLLPFRLALLTHEKGNVGIGKKKGTLGAPFVICTALA
jgi:hypothetical protein